jgi:hypothetical protein
MDKVLAGLFCIAALYAAWWQFKQLMQRRRK